MSYNDFIAQYPYVDLFLEFFGKIVPVAVAIIAIIVNNAKSSNRDKRKNYKMKCERYLNESAFRTFFCFKQ